MLEFYTPPRQVVNKLINSPGCDRLTILHVSQSYAVGGKVLDIKRCVHYRQREQRRHMEHEFNGFSEIREGLQMGMVNGLLRNLLGFTQLS